jgi:hypothetical protein
MTEIKFKLNDHPCTGYVSLTENITDISSGERVDVAYIEWRDDTTSGGREYGYGYISFTLDKKEVITNSINDLPQEIKNYLNEEEYKIN